MRASCSSVCPGTIVPMVSLRKRSRPPLPCPPSMTALPYSRSTAFCSEDFGFSNRSSNMLVHLARQQHTRLMSVEQPAVRGDSQVETFASVLAAVGEGAILALAAGEIQPDPTSFADDGYDAAGEHSRTAPDKRTIVGIGLNVATAVERLWAKRSEE